MIAAMLRLATITRPYLSHIPLFRPLPREVNIPWQLYLLFSAVWVILMLGFNVYDGSKNIRVVDEYTNLTTSAILAGITLAGLLYLSYRELSRGLFLLFILLAYLSLLLWRVIARALYSYRNRMQGLVRRVLIIGAGPVGKQVEEQLDEMRYLDLNVVGYLDDDAQKQQRPEVLGTVSEMRTHIRRLKVTDVIVTLPARSFDRLGELVTSTEDIPLHFWVVPDIFHLSVHQATVVNFAGIPMFDLRALALNDYQRLTKRILDVLIAVPVTLITLPLMGLVALAIWIDDGRPVLFPQKRMGENGRVFTMYKFRTMRQTPTEEQPALHDKQGNPTHKAPDDPRVTRIGRFLRRYSLDELPQLFNVLRGTMSLVGPRPELPELVDNYEPWQRKRFAVPQGMTGWWQTHGRSDRPMHLHTEDDLYYVQNYSIWLDIRILIITIWIVIRGKGAY